VYFILLSSPQQVVFCLLVALLGQFAATHTSMTSLPVFRSSLHEDVLFHAFFPQFLVSLVILDIEVL